MHCDGARGIGSLGQRTHGRGSRQGAGELRRRQTATKEVKRNRTTTRHS